MEITRETDYAIRCVLFLARQPDTVFMVGEIAEKQDVPKAFLAKILQKLVNGGIVSSIRGVKGGFRLLKKPKDISLLKVIEAVDGPVSLNVCVVDKLSCERSAHCSIHPVWVDLQQDLAKKMNSIHFDKLVKNEKSFMEGKKKKSKRRRA
jgi:Rrf2 family protein